MTFLFGFIVVSGCAVAFLSTEEIYSLVQFSLSSPPQLEIDVQPPVSTALDIIHNMYLLPWLLLELEENETQIHYEAEHSLRSWGITNIDEWKHKGLYLASDTMPALVPVYFYAVLICAIISVCSCFGYFLCTETQFYCWELDWAVFMHIRWRTAIPVLIMKKSSLSRLLMHKNSSVWLNWNSSAKNWCVATNSWV